jgi:hypothetical protein
MSSKTFKIVFSFIIISASLIIIYMFYEMIRIINLQ